MYCDQIPIKTMACIRYCTVMCAGVRRCNCWVSSVPLRITTTEHQLCSTTVSVLSLMMTKRFMDHAVKKNRLLNDAVQSDWVVSQPFNTHTKIAEQRTIIPQYCDWYTGRWRVGCYIWCSEEGPGRAVAPPSPLLAVPNVTAHSSTASVPTSYYLM